MKKCSSLCQTYKPTRFICIHATNLTSKKSSQTKHPRAQTFTTACFRGVKHSSPVWNRLLKRKDSGSRTSQLLHNCSLYHDLPILNISLKFTNLFSRSVAVRNTLYPSPCTHKSRSGYWSGPPPSSSTTLLSHVPCRTNPKIFLKIDSPFFYVLLLAYTYWPHSQPHPPDDKGEWKPEHRWWSGSNTSCHRLFLVSCAIHPKNSCSSKWSVE